MTNSNIWLTNVVATLTTNKTVNLQFTIAGGSNGVPYDVFGNSALGNYNGTNVPWAWMGQGYQCTTYMLTNLPQSSAFLVLGLSLDSDHDGLTDAYELLSSKTDPFNPDTSGDGMLDGWKILWGLNPLLNNTAQSGERSNYTYDPVGWLQTLTGIRSETIGVDAEGNVQTAQ